VNRDEEISLPVVGHLGSPDVLEIDVRLARQPYLEPQAAVDELAQTDGDIQRDRFLLDPVCGDGAGGLAAVARIDDDRAQTLPAGANLLASRGRS